jgi:hypothetical protein
MWVRQVVKRAGQAAPCLQEVWWDKQLNKEPDPKLEKHR